MAPQLRILFAEDNDSFRTVVSEVIGAFHQVTEVSTFVDAKRLISDSAREFHIAILDKQFPDGDGFDLITAIKEHRPEIGIIMLTSDGEMKSVNSCLSAGAHDYVIKSSSAVSDLIVRIQMVANRLSTNAQYKKLSEVVKDAFRFELVGRSQYISDLRTKIAAQKGTLSPVLICGESGTGKELIARRLYAIEGDFSRPFVAVNCGAIPVTLIESELFGHEKGAFTGATQRKVGKFELADGGDLFLDEIGELPEQTQAALLRVLQDGELTRIGGTQTKKINVRVIAATNRNLEEEVAQGTFRKDLYYRLSVIRYDTQSLRHRPEDIEPLLLFALERKQSAFTMSDHALGALQAHTWPGNIRELQNTLERAQLSAQMRKSKLIEQIDIRLDPIPGDRASLNDTLSKLMPSTLDEIDSNSFTSAKKHFERQFIEKALRICSGNVSLTAKKLGLAKSTLFLKMNELSVTTPRAQKRMATRETLQ